MLYVLSATTAPSHSSAYVRTGESKPYVEIYLIQLFDPLFGVLEGAPSRIVSLVHPLALERADEMLQALSPAGCVCALFDGATARMEAIAAPLGLRRLRYNGSGGLLRV